MEQLEIREGSDFPSQRTYHAATLVERFMVVLGGETQSDLNDFWALDLESRTWHKPDVLGANNFKPKRFHTAVTLNKTQVVTFGGCHSEYQYMNDLNVFEMKDFIQNPSQATVQCTLVISPANQPVPAARWGHAAAVHDNKMYILGGRNDKDMDDITYFDGLSQEWTKITIAGDQPHPRRRHSIAFIDSALVLFGGFNGQFHSDLYISDFISRSMANPEVSQSTLAKDFASLRIRSGLSEPEITFLLESGEKVRAHKHMILFRASLSGLSYKQIAGQNIHSSELFLQQPSGRMSSQQKKQAFVKQDIAQEVDQFYQLVLKMDKNDVLPLKNVKSLENFEIFLEIHYAGTLSFPVSLAKTRELLELA